MYVDGFLKWQPAVFLLTCPSIYLNNPRLEFICTKNLQTFPLNMILVYSKSTKLIKLHHLYTFISQCFIFGSCLISVDISILSILALSFLYFVNRRHYMQIWWWNNRCCRCQLWFQLLCLYLNRFQRCWVVSYIDYVLYVCCEHQRSDRIEGARRSFLKTGQIRGIFESEYLNTLFLSFEDLKEASCAKFVDHFVSGWRFEVVEQIYLPSFRILAAESHNLIVLLLHWKSPIFSLCLCTLLP